MKIGASIVFGVMLLKIPFQKIKLKKLKEWTPEEPHSFSL
jgi:hypothetical protein